MREVLQCREFLEEVLQQEVQGQIEQCEAFRMNTYLILIIVFAVFLLWSFFLINLSSNQYMYCVKMVEELSACCNDRSSFPCGEVIKPEVLFPV